MEATERKNVNRSYLKTIYYKRRNVTLISKDKLLKKLHISARSVNIPFAGLKQYA